MSVISRVVTKVNLLFMSEYSLLIEIERKVVIQAVTVKCDRANKRECVCRNVSVPPSDLMVAGTALCRLIIQFNERLASPRCVDLRPRRA